MAKKNVNRPHDKEASANEMEENNQERKIDLEFCRLSYNLGAETSDSDVYLMIKQLECDTNWLSSSADYAMKYLHQNDPLYEVIYNFDWREYRMANADLSDLTPKQLVEHYHRHGIIEPRSDNGNSMILDRRPAICSIAGWAEQGKLVNDTRIQAIVHCYYDDMLSILEPCLRLLSRIGATIHVYVTNDEISDQRMDTFLGDLSITSSHVASPHQWKRSINYFEDWPTFHQAYEDGLFDTAGITYKFQTKKSARLAGDGGRLWTEELLQAVAGSYGIVYDVCDSIVHKGYSMVGSKLHRRTGLGANPTLVKEIANKVGLSLKDIEQCPFVAGSMFAVDNDLARLFYSALGELDYGRLPAGGNEHCGRYYGHAIERCIGYFCGQRSRGIRWLI